MNAKAFDDKYDSTSTLDARLLDREIAELQAKLATAEQRAREAETLVEAIRSTVQ